MRTSQKQDDAPNLAADRARAAADPSPLNQQAAWRAIDANLNRAAEAARVIEDVVRFGFSDVGLTEQAKGLRVRIAEHSDRIPRAARLAPRDVAGDVGPTASLELPSERLDLYDLLAANGSRLAQALRSLEEFCKLVDSTTALDWERLRYDAYAFLQAAWHTWHSREALSWARIYVLVDGGTNSDVLARNAQRLIDAGVDLIQLRDKTLDDRQLVERGNILTQLTQGRPTRWIMNDRPDLAVLAGAAGVHLGQDDVSVADARRIVGPHRWIGVSTHSLPQAERAVRDGADYIGVGPTFASRTKSFDSVMGLDLLRDVARRVTLPAFAIGGIDGDNVDQVVACGFGRVALSAAAAQSTGTHEPSTNGDSGARELRDLVQRLRQALLAVNLSPQAIGHARQEGD